MNTTSKLKSKQSLGVLPLPGIGTLSTDHITNVMMSISGCLMGQNHIKR